MSAPDAREEAATHSARRVHYRFAPLDRRGLVAGWRAGQVACVAAGLLFALLIVRTLPDLEGVALAALVVVTAGLAATWPIQGLTAEQWAPQVIRYGAARLLGRDVGLTGAPTAGYIAFHGRAGSSGATRTRSPLGPSNLRPGRLGQSQIVLGRRPDSVRSRGPGASVAPGRCPSGPFAGLSIVEVPDGRVPVAMPGPASRGVSSPGEQPFFGATPAGAILDERAGVGTAVFRAAAEGFLMLEPRERDSRVSTWARLLASLAREASSVHRIQWLAMSTPGDADARARSESVAKNGARRAFSSETGAASAARRRARHSYEELACTLESVSCLREVLLAVSVRNHDLGHVIREAEAIAARLSEAGFAVEGPLEARQIAGIMRGTFATRRQVAPFSPWPWPMAVRECWSSARVEGTWQRTFWVEEWPRVDVPADFLAPVLLADDVCFRISVVMEPVSPAKAAREAEQRRTAGIADAELRSRGGFLATQRRLREEEALLRREAELADGHGHYRFSGYVTASASSEEELEEASRSMLQAGAQSGIELRPCYGCQATALAYTLPLCRGLA